MQNEAPASEHCTQTEATTNFLFTYSGFVGIVHAARGTKDGEGANAKMPDLGVGGGVTLDMLFDVENGVPKTGADGRIAAPQ